MKISLLYFANRNATDAPAQYRLLMDSARFADRNGFEAVWLPERHFHPFGGAYPNPALAAAALAAVTDNVRLRAGSVVLPLNDVLRVAEDWMFIDNLSNGRVDLAFAAGWNANDFVLAPERFRARRSLLGGMIDDFRTLWSGGSLARRNGRNEETRVRVYPAAVQRMPGIWLTSSSSRRTFVAAGTGGFNVLTAMLFMPVDELAAKIAEYKKARADVGMAPENGRVTLMLHTYLGDSIDSVRQTVRSAFIEYLDSSTDLWGQEMRRLHSAAMLDKEALLSFAFDRYFSTAALFGTEDSCLPFVGQLEEAGVGEIACLVDFGLPDSQVLAGLEHLAVLAERVA